MNALARLEAACATLVETTFARIFPSDLQPAQVARKLIAVMQSAPSDTYLVRVNPLDYARFGKDRPFLEARWSALLAETAGDGNLAEHRVLLHEDERVVAGSVAIEAVVDEARPRQTLAIVVEDGGIRRRYRLDDGLTIGRTDANAVVLADPRVSREHARIVASDGTYAIEDRDSSNGTFVNGTRVQRTLLSAGDRITVGETEMQVEALDA